MLLLLHTLKENFLMNLKNIELNSKRLRSKVLNSPQPLC